FGLAVAVLLLEMGLVAGRRGVLPAAMCVPAGLVVLTLVGHRPDPIYREFLEIFKSRLGGDPLFITLRAVVCFYAYAAQRRVGLAIEPLTASLLALAVVGPDTLNLGRLTAPHPVPILAAGALQLALGVKRRGSWRCLIGAGGLVAGASL